jgi:hypothetical protein
MILNIYVKKAAVAAFFVCAFSWGKEFLKAEFLKTRIEEQEQASRGVRNQKEY